MIISLGYRIKSKVATNFRKWATERLKENMIKEYLKALKEINSKIKKEEKYE